MKHIILVQCAKFWILCLLYLCLVDVCKSLAQPPTTTPSDKSTNSTYVVPLVYDSVLYPFPIVALRINGGAPLPFLLDTGSSFSLLVNDWVAKQFHLNPNGHKLIVNGNAIGDMATTQHAEMVCETMANTHEPALYDLAITVAGIPDQGIPADFPSPTRLAGVIGMTAFKKFTSAEIDFVAKTLTLSTRKHLPLHIPEAITLPLGQRNDLYTTTVRGSDGSTFNFLLDTGSDMVSMTESMAARFTFRPTPPIVRPIWTATGSLTANIRLLTECKLGNFHEHDVVVRIINNNKDDGTGGILGMSLLTRFRLMIDFQHKQLLLVRNANYNNQLRLPGLSCISVAPRNGKLTVIDVLTGSAAAQAGVQPGDTVIVIDGHQVAMLSIATTQQLLDGVAGTQCDLVVSRKEQPLLHITFERQSIFAMASDPPIGIGIAKSISAEGKMLVEAIYPTLPQIRRVFK